MRSVRDTFTHFVADNIATYSGGDTIPVKGIWKSLNTSSSDILQVNAINIGFIDATYDTHVTSLTCSLDVIHVDELTAIDWSDALWKLLSVSCYTPELDYSGASPSPTGANIMWPMSGVRFRPIADDHYFRWNCRLVLKSQN
jgi:hypothetical protein